MTLATAVAPLAAYAVFFQTAVYLSLPRALRTSWAPLFTGLVGAIVALGSGVLYGFDTIGLGVADPITALTWGLIAVLGTSLLGGIMSTRPSLRAGMADPRLASMTRRQAVSHVLLRIPLFTALIEEVFFRGVLHAALVALYSTPVAVWMGAGLFGLWHIGPALDRAEAVGSSPRAQVFETAATVVATTLAGAFLVWLRVETGSIWASVAVHAAVNMTMAVFARSYGRLGRERDSAPAEA